MTQYLLAVHSVTGEPDPAPDVLQKMYEAVDTFNQEIKDAGKWVFAGGLQPVETATTVRHEAGQVLLTDGPFAETREHLGGFWIVEADDLDEALDWAKRGARACQGDVEVRPFQSG